MKTYRPFPESVIPAQVAAVSVAVLSGARTVREVMSACGWKSPSNAHAYVRVAHAMGLVRWDPEKDRTLRPGLRLARALRTAIEEAG